jgi:hypothetical protein
MTNIYKKIQYFYFRLCVVEACIQKYCDGVKERSGDFDGIIVPLCPAAKETKYCSGIVSSNTGQDTGYSNFSLQLNFLCSFRKMQK